MKKIIITLLFLTINTMTAFALTGEDFENQEIVVNSVNVNITREEYNTLKEKYPDGMISIFTRKTIDNILNEEESIIDREIEITTFYDQNGNELYTTERVISENGISVNNLEFIPEVYGLNWSVTHETTSKRLFMSISKDGNYYTVELYNYWKTIPSVKKWDDIGIMWTNNASFVGGTAEGVQRSLKSDGTENLAIYNLDSGLDHFKFGNKGVGLSMNLFDTGTNYVNYLGLIVSNASGSKITGSYQHAKNSSITFNESKSYTFSASGRGGIFNYTTTTIWNKYDGMQGVYYILP